MISQSRTDAASVLIAEQDPVTRAGMKNAVEAGRFVVCAEVSDAQEALAAAIDAQPDLCLVDVDLPGDGIAVAAEIASRRPGPLVVMLTADPHDDELLRAVRAGAVGYLRKDMDPGRLPHAIEGALAGEAAVPRQLVTRLIDEICTRSRRRSSAVVRERGVDLTSREWDVLDLLEKGSGTAEIAGALSLSPVTVRRHLSAALRKLGAADRQAAVSLLRGHVPA